MGKAGLTVADDAALDKDEREDDVEDAEGRDREQHRVEPGHPASLVGPGRGPGPTGAGQDAAISTAVV